MTAKEQIKTLGITKEQEKILDLACEHEMMKRFFEEKKDNEKCEWYKALVYEDLNILETLNPYINWVTAISDITREE